MKITAIKSILILITIIVSLIVFSCKQESIQKELQIETVLNQRDFTNTEIDSVSQQIFSRKPDSLGVDILIHLYSRSLRTEVKRTDLLDSAIYFAEKINYISGLANAYDRA